MVEYRMERVGRLIREKIGALIVEGKIKDPRVDSLLSITRVEVSRDLSYADVYVSAYKSPGELTRSVGGLQSASGFIRGRLAAEMHIRQIPKLRFHDDPGVREGFDMIKKIEALTAHGDS
jgi:ribosome-binding factor A